MVGQPSETRHTAQGDLLLNKARGLQRSASRARAFWHIPCYPSALATLPSNAHGRSPKPWGYPRAGQHKSGLQEGQKNKCRRGYRPRGTLLVGMLTVHCWAQILRSPENHLTQPQELKETKPASTCCSLGTSKHFSPVPGSVPNKGWKSPSPREHLLQECQGLSSSSLTLFSSTAQQPILRPRASLSPSSGLFLWGFSRKFSLPTYVFLPVFHPPL